MSTRSVSVLQTGHNRSLKVPSCWYGKIIFTIFSHEKYFALRRQTASTASHTIGLGTTHDPLLWEDHRPQIGTGLNRDVRRHLRQYDLRRPKGLSRGLTG